jgi:hypothetical protein
MVEVCVPNIGPRERAKRLRYGIVFAVLSLAAAAALIGTGAPRSLRLLLILPFWISGSGIFQYLEKT